MHSSSKPNYNQDKEKNTTKKIPLCNYTQMPNICFDYWMSRLSGNEFKILCCISRMTFGWHRQKSPVSLTKLSEMSGIPRSNISPIITKLIELGLVLKTERFSEEGDHASNEYTIDVHEEVVVPHDHLVVSDDHQVFEDDHPSRPERPPLLEDIHIVKKDIKETSSESSEMAEFFLSKIVEKKPDFKRPNLKTWATQFDWIIRIDKRTVPDIKAAITWLTSDPFWFSVVMCPQSLRKNFDKIEARMSIPSGSNNLVDQIKAQFQNHAKYNGAECFIDSEGIAFSRGMTHMQVKFNDKGLKDQFDSILRKFGIR